MPLRQRIGVLLAALSLVAAVVPHAALAVESPPINAVFLDSEPGEYIGGGRTELFEPPTFRIYPISQVTFDPRWVTIAARTDGTTAAMRRVGLEFVAPRGQALDVGTYTGAARAGFASDGQPGMDIDSDGRGCNNVTGHFNVHELTRGGDGAVLAFAASFVQYCSSTAVGPALHGEVRFNSQVPLRTWRVSASTLDLGAHLVRSTSPQQSVSVTNTGDVPMSIGVSVTGGDFAVADATGCLEVALARGASCSVDVSVTPSAQGPTTAGLVLAIEGRPPRTIKLLASGQLATSVALQAPASSTFLRSTTLTATVLPATVTGLVRFEAGGVLVGLAGVNAGTATLTAPIPPGHGDLVARFVANPTWAASVSDAVQHASRWLTWTTLATDTRTAEVGRPVRLVAALHVAGPRVPSGSLLIRDVTNGDVLASTPVGAAAIDVSLTMVRLVPSTVQLRAEYSGDSVHAPSTADLTVTVDRIRGGISFRAPVTSIYPGPTRVEATVVPLPDGGTVVFTIDGTVAARVAPDPVTGEAFMDAPLEPGTHRLGASFSGSELFTSGTHLRRPS